MIPAEPQPGSPAGGAVDRIDGRAKVTGAARYGGDHPAERLAHAHVVVSTITRGRISALDTAEAEQAPGVLAVYSPDNRLRLYNPSGHLGENHAPMQDHRVRYRGQIIAMVVAETPEQARDAAARVQADYAAEEPRASLEAGSPGEPPSGGLPGSPPASSTVLAPGVSSMESAFAACAVEVSTTVTAPAQHHVAMEPHATTAVWRDGQLTVHTGAQAPQLQAAAIADRLGVEADRVRLVCRYTGGGFGSRVAVWSDGTLAAAAARALGRPVRLVLTREQVFSAIPHRSAINQTVRLGASARGRLNALSHESDAAMPAVGGWVLSPAQDMSTVLYRAPNLAVDQRQVTLDIGPSWAMRGPNETPGSFALETAMDELAARTGTDPLELRRRNLATEVPGSGLPFSSKHLDDCYRIGAERFGWSERPNEPGSRTDGDRLVGMGMATTVYPGPREGASARVRFRDDGKVVVSSAITDIGTGAGTMLAIAAADAAGVPLRRVKAVLGDSALPPGGSPAYGSQTTLNTVPAVREATGAALDKLVKLAVDDSGSPFHGLDPGDVDYDGGHLSSADRSLGFGRLLSMLGTSAVEATAESLPGDEADRYAFYSFGAHFCEVRVNRFTREPRISRFTSVFDIGRVVNAKATRSQLVGGVVFGIGCALLEADHLEGNGRFANGNLADYLVPVNADVPEIDVHWLDRPDPVISGFGARGAGEIGTVGAAAAIANAVFNATGTRVRDLPITLDKLLG